MEGKLRRTLQQASGSLRQFLIYGLYEKYW